MITKPFQPQNVMPLRANLLAGTVALLGRDSGVTGLGSVLGGRKGSGLLPEPPSTLQAATQRNGSWGGRCTEASAPSQAKATGPNLPTQPFCRGPPFPRLLPPTGVAQHPQGGASRGDEQLSLSARLRRSHNPGL